MNFSLKKIFTFKTLLIVGIIACLCCIIPFSKNLIVTIMEKFVLHRELRDIQKWDDILVHSMSFFALIGAFWFFFWYTAKYSVKNLIVSSAITPDITLLMVCSHGTSSSKPQNIDFKDSKFSNQNNLCVLQLLFPAILAIMITDDTSEKQYLIAL